MKDWQDYDICNRGGTNPPHLQHEPPQGAQYYTATGIMLENEDLPKRIRYKRMKHE